MSVDENEMNWRSISLDLECSPRKIRASRTKIDKKNLKFVKNSKYINIHTDLKAGDNEYNNSHNTFENETNKLKYLNSRDFSRLLNEVFVQYNFETSIHQMNNPKHQVDKNTDLENPAYVFHVLNERKIKRRKRIENKRIKIKEEILEDRQWEQGSSSTPQTNDSKKEKTITKKAESSLNTTEAVTVPKKIYMVIGKIFCFIITI